MAGGLEGDAFMGRLAEEHRGLLNIRYPVEVGMAAEQTCISCMHGVSTKACIYVFLILLFYVSMGL